jgi:hypothetical protein
MCAFDAASASGGTLWQPRVSLDFANLDDSDVQEGEQRCFARFYVSASIDGSKQTHSTSFPSGS